jgi:hypothetical protein
MGVREHFQNPLVNPTWDQVVEREPLMEFSHYLSGRVNVLLAVADEIVENLDTGFAEECINGGQVERAESLMWLWMLGAYEVVRTMSQAKACFSDRAFDELSRLKKSLAVVRMPAAKTERSGKKEPVTSNRRPAGWDVKKRDLLVNDPEVQPDISARTILAEFDRVFSAITKHDVLARHEDSYSSEPNKGMQPTPQSGAADAWRLDNARLQLAVSFALPKNATPGARSTAA